MIERKELEQIKLPPLQILGSQILEAKYDDQGLSTWQFEDVDNSLKNRESSLVTAFPQLDEMAAKKLEIRKDDLEREKVREHLRQQNELHIDMFNALKQWIDKKTEYLKIKDACESLTD